jgi:hypothetical protein
MPENTYELYDNSETAIFMTFYDVRKVNAC